MTKEERDYLNDLSDHCISTGKQTIIMLVAVFVILITVGIVRILTQ